MGHTVGANTANYTWDVNSPLPQTLQDGTNTYVYGLGRISSTDGAGNQTYYTSDGLGSTADLTDASATKTDGYTYDAFGAPTHSPGGSPQPFGFTGQQTDADSGLQYLRARYYDPATGRFISQDREAGSIYSPITQDRYSYTGANPTSRSDPLGMRWLDDSKESRFGSTTGSALIVMPQPCLVGCNNLFDATKAVTDVISDATSSIDDLIGDKDPFDNFEHCKMLFEACVERGWAAKYKGEGCGNCFTRCLAEGTWPFDRCGPDVTPTPFSIRISDSVASRSCG